MKDDWGNEWPDPRHEALTNPYPLGSMGNLMRFRSARAKLRRVTAVHDKMLVEKRGLEMDLYSAMRIVRSGDGSEYRFFVDELPQMPGHWPVTVGESLYNVRSALDHAAYELAILGLGRELTADEARWSRFPLVTKRSVYNEKNLDRWLPGVDDETRALIERVQPYPERDRNYSPNAYEQAAYYLGLLNDLGNVEKHRHTHFIVLSSGPGSWMDEHPEPWFFEGALEPGRLVAKVPYCPEFNPYVSMQPRPSFSTLLIHPQGPSAMPGVLSVLAFMAERVLDVLDPSQWFDGRRSKHLEPLPELRQHDRATRAVQRGDPTGAGSAGAP